MTCGYWFKDDNDDDDDDNYDNFDGGGDVLQLLYGFGRCSGNLFACLLKESATLRSN